MKNKLIITFMLLLFVLPLLAPSGLVLDVPHPSSASPNVVGSAASEEENIDSMDVHPINRWGITNNGWISATVSDSLLILNDTGDGSSDSYELKRDLRDLDGSIEIRFLVSSNTTSSGADDFHISIANGAHTATTRNLLTFDSIDATGATATRFIYYDINGGVHFVPIDEDIHAGLWYIVRIDYDILRSEIRWRIFFDNGSKLFDYSQDEIADERFNLFSQTDLSMVIRAGSQTLGLSREDFVDYVKAPFKEREWTQTTTPSDADWIVDSPFQAYVQDDIDEFAGYSLTVPFFDQCSGTLFLNMNNITNEVDGDNTDVFFQVFGVDADDGGLHELYEINIHYGFVNPTRFLTVSLTTENEGLPFFQDSDTGTIDDNIRLDFDIGMYEDRSKVRINTRHYIGEEDDEPVDVVGQADVSATVTDPSNEFVLKVFYLADFIGDMEFTGKLDDFSFISRDIFSDIVSGIAEGIWNFLAGIFITIGLFLAGIFKFIGDIIVAALQALEPLLTAISNAISILQTAIESAITSVLSELTNIITEIQALASDIATAIWDGIGTALDFIVDVVEDIWIALIAILDDIIAQLLILAEDVADFVFAAIDFLLDLLLTVLDEFWQLVEGIVFFIWDLTGLPDVLAFFDSLLTTIFDVVAAAPEIILDIMSWVELFANFVLIIWWFNAIFLSFSEVNFNPFEGIAGVIERMFQNILPFGLFGNEIYVPQALVTIPLTIFLILEDSMFNIW